MKIIAVLGLIIVGISLMVIGMLIDNGIPALIGLVMFGVGSAIGFTLSINGREL